MSKRKRELTRFHPLLLQKYQALATLIHCTRYVENMMEILYLCLFLTLIWGILQSPQVCFHCTLSHFVFINAPTFPPQPRVFATFWCFHKFKTHTKTSGWRRTFSSPTVKKDGKRSSRSYSVFKGNCTYRNRKKLNNYHYYYYISKATSPMTLAWTLTLTQTSSLVSLSSRTSSHRTPSCWAMYSHVTFRPPGKHTGEEKNRKKNRDLISSLLFHTTHTHTHTHTLSLSMSCCMRRCFECGQHDGEIREHSWLMSKQNISNTTKPTPADVNISWHPQTHTHTDTRE